MCLGTRPLEPYCLSSLRILGSVGEPINPAAWYWYFRHVGKEKTPIADTWWQTETGQIMIAPVAGAVSLKPGSATYPLPGICADVVDEKGTSMPPRQGGYLVVKKPWPAMARTIVGDAERFRKQYWSKFSGLYFTGDGAHKDEEGYFWIKGRIDDVLNVSGHRLGTMELESTLVAHESVSEAAVVGIEDEITGQAIVAFVVPMKDCPDTARQLSEKLKDFMAERLGKLARPKHVYVIKALPKTRSGKIMRRILREVAGQKDITGDVSTLENRDVVEQIRI